MGCYTVPLASAFVLFFFRKSFPSFGSRDHFFLNLLFSGAAIFGVVDHLWNGDLFVFSFLDIVLGFVITFVILVCWLFLVKYRFFSVVSSCSRS